MYVENSKETQFYDPDSTNEQSQITYRGVLTPPFLHSDAAKRNTSEGVLYCSAECFLSLL